MNAASWMRTIAFTLAAAALLYGTVLGLLWFKQERLLFQPQVLPPSHRFDTAADVHEVWVDVAGARLNALHLRLPQPRGVVFFLHGNAGSLDNWFVNLDFYRRAGLDLFMLDYRGYGKSSGHITSEAQLHDDVRRVWRSVAPRYAGLPRVFLGRSLGTGLAAALAAEEAPELTVLVSPYLSMQALAVEHYPWVPSRLLRYPLRTDQWLPQLRGAVLLVHGDQDRLIEPSHSLRLKALRPASRLVLVPGAGHNDLQQFPAYSDALADALAAALDSAPAPR
jgi:uncharacterized protein